MSHAPAPYAAPCLAEAPAAAYLAQAEDCRFAFPTPAHLTLPALLHVVAARTTSPEVRMAQRAARAAAVPLLLAGTGRYDVQATRERVNEAGERYTQYAADITAPAERSDFPCADRNGYHAPDWHETAAEALAPLFADALRHHAQRLIEGPYEQENVADFQAVASL